MEWDQFIGTGSNENYGYSVQQTTDSGYIIAGYTTVMGMGANVYLVKTDASGDTVWTKNYGSTEYDNGWAVQQTFDGGYIIAAQWDTTACLIKTDANGDTLWIKTYLPSGSTISVARSVQQTSDSGYIVSGAANFPGKWGEVFLIKTDSAGEPLC